MLSRKMFGTLFGDRSTSISSECTSRKTLKQHVASKLNTEHIFLTFIFGFIVKIKACCLFLRISSAITFFPFSVSYSTLVTSSAAIFKILQQILCFGSFNESCRECYWTGSSCLLSVTTMTTADRICLLG